MRLFLDANVIFSAAHNPNGNGRALFRFARVQRASYVIASRYAIEEAARNIALKYPECSGELEELLGQLGLTPEPMPTMVAAAVSIGLPEKDAPILAAAIAGRADALVTGDSRHFGALYGKAIEGVRIITPAEAVAHILDTFTKR